MTISGIIKHCKGKLPDCSSLKSIVQHLVDVSGNVSIEDVSYKSEVLTVSGHLKYNGIIKECFVSINVSEKYVKVAGLNRLAPAIADGFANLIRRELRKRNE